MTSEATAPSLFDRLRQLASGVMRGDRPLFAMFQTMGTQGLILCANLGTGVIMARLLGPYGRGEFAAVSIWPQLLAMMATAGLNGAIVFRMRRNAAESGAVVGAALLAGVAFAVLAAAAGVFVIAGLLAQYPAPVVLFAQLCLVSVLVNSVSLIVKQSYTGAGFYGLSNFTNLLPQVLHLVVLIGFWLFGTLTAQNAVLSLLGTGLVALLMVLPGFVRKVQPRFRGAWRELPALLSYSGRGSLNDVVFTAAFFLDRLVLIPLLSPAQLGLYAVAFSFSRIIQLAQTAVMSVFLSHLSGRDSQEGKRVHDHALRYLLAGMSIACVALWIVGEWLLSFAFGAEFAAANWIFRLLVIEAALSVLSQVSVQLFLAHDRPGVVSTLQVATLGLSLLCLLILVPHYGAIGAATALLIAGVARWLALIVAIRRVLGLSWPRLLLNREDLRYMSGKLR
jgi:O-antigen/teichoic acid export membrane protein